LRISALFLKIKTKFEGKAKKSFITAVKDYKEDKMMHIHFLSLIFRFH